SKGLNSKYYEVKATVEPPDNFEFYEKIIDLINKIYLKEAPILELNETTDLFSDIFFPEQKQLETRKPQLSVQELLSNLKEGFSTFIDLSIEPLINILNFWSQDIVNKMFYNNTQMRNDLIDMKENLTTGIRSLQNSFNFSLQDDLKKLDFYIDDKLDKLDEGLNNIEKTIHQFKENLTLKINQLIENTFLQNNNQIIDNFDKNLGDLNTINEMNEIVLQTLEPDYIELEKLFNIIDPTKSRIKGALEDNQEIILNNFGKKLPIIKNIFSNLDKDLRKLLSDLKAAILVLEGSKGPVLDKIEKLENEKKNLHNTIRELKNEINELKK
ncbi:MAG: hypothetical protein ACFFC1_07600, partial [Promethearchaeota archaeon]